MSEHRGTPARNGQIGVTHILSAALVLALVASAICQPRPARADLFGPISLASEGTIGGGRPQQAEYAHDAAISGNGQYVAFDGSLGGVSGVWRRDLATGMVDQVAGGDAELPSISENGQYISFTTNESVEQLIQHTDGSPDAEYQKTHQPPNVYVRDMGYGPSQPAAFTIVSAVNGGTQALSYEYAGAPGTQTQSEEEQHYGSLAAGRSAIDAQGNEVVFVTSAISNLVGPKTPALQVAVRYLATHQTKLVSGEYQEGHTSETPVSQESFGAIYPGSPKALGFRVPPADAYWGNDPPPGASISADGSTVAWMGEDISKQAPMLPGESPGPLYTEPLWRRIAPGSETSTERVTGGSDPTSAACVASGERKLSDEPLEQSSSDPCQGPFKVGFQANDESRGIWSEAGGGGEADFVPRLSADGYEVAFISSAVPTRLGAGFGEPEGQPADLYIADMHAGLTRDQALTPLTEIGGQNVAASSPVTDFDISADGEQVAFTTRRSVFALGSPAYISAPLAEPGESELFDADLADDTLTLVTHGYGGEPSEQTHRSVLECPGSEDAYCSPITIGSQSPSFSTNGHLIAFSSTASNLVFGDGNSSRSPLGEPEGELDGSDALVVEREPVLSLPTPQFISAPPAMTINPLWQLSATALSRPDGSVLLYVAVPGPGTLRAGALGSVLVSSFASKSRKGHASSSKHTREILLTRTVAKSSDSVHASGGEVVELTLKLAKPYAPLASERDGLQASVSLAFTAPSHPGLHQTIQATFRRATHSAKKSPKARHREAKR